HIRLNVYKLIGSLDTLGGDPRHMCLSSEPNHSNPESEGGSTCANTHTQTLFLTHTHTPESTPSRKKHTHTHTIESPHTYRGKEGETPSGHLASPLHLCVCVCVRSEEHTSELQSHLNRVC